MKPYFWPVLSLVFLAGTFACSTKGDSPVQTAIENKIREQLGDPSAKLSFNTIEKIDSSTFGQEFARRRATLELRLSKNEELMQKYLGARQSAKASEKSALIKKDKEHIAALAELEKELCDTLPRTAFYEYKFSGTARKSDGTKVLIEDMHAAVTPDFEVLAMTGEGNSILKYTGKVIPGYTELFNE